MISARCASAFAGMTAAAGLLCACGSSLNTGLFGDPVSAGPDASTTDASTTDASTAAVFSTDAGETGVGPEADGASVVIFEAGQPPATDAGHPGKDAAPDGTSPPPDPKPVVACAAASCSLPSQVCCRSGPPTDLATFACAASVGDCVQPGDLPIPCDDARDCTALGHPGTVCCAQGTFDQNAQILIVSLVSCRSAGSCQGEARRIICDSQAPGACTGSLTCKPSVSALPGYDLCQ